MKEKSDATLTVHWSKSADDDVPYISDERICFFRVCNGGVVSFRTEDGSGVLIPSHAYDYLELKEDD